MKKFIMVLLVGALLLSLVACGDAGNENGTINDFNDLLEQIQEQGKENASVEMKEYVLAGEGDFSYEETENGVKITGYTGTETFLQIPDKIGGKPVTSIGDNCFALHPLVAVKLPDSVQEIGFNAFQYATNLVKVELGSGLRVIRDSAFEGCVALTEIELPDGLEHIGRRAFGWAPIKEIRIPETVTFLSSGAFILNSALETITVPGSVGVLNRQVFSTCSSLREVYLSEGITTIEYGAFEDCASLEKVHFPASCTDISTAAFSASKGFVLCGPAGSAVEEYADLLDYSFEAE